jgi:hypothetical protein
MRLGFALFLFSLTSKKKEKDTTDTIAVTLNSGRLKTPNFELNSGRLKTQARLQTVDGAVTLN